MTLIGIEEVIKHAVKDTQVEAFIKHEYFYITPKGHLYHEKSCKYCKGKTLKEIDVASDEGSNYNPCGCVRGRTVSNYPHRCKVKATEYITAFLDESRRDNPGRLLDPKQPEKQNVMSYVICRGYITDEKQINRENILEEDVYISPSNSRNLNVAIHETIARIMMKGAFIPGAHNIIIYSDNQGACEEWESIELCRYLSRQYTSVSVEYIPREKNTYADKLGRNKELVVVNKGEITGMVAIRQEMSKMLEELTFIRNYFPNPRKMIPNLVEELRLIAGDTPKEVIDAS